MRSPLIYLVLSSCFALPLAHGGETVPAASPAKAVASKLAKPLWSELTAPQKTALAPLAGEWDKMDEIRKRKWLEIASRYAAMKPEDQSRIQERMRDWVKLTPEQRMAARENFARAKQIDPETKSTQWQQYQQLSEEEKQRLAASASQKKSVTSLPANAIKTNTALPPLKLGPKPATPPAAIQQPAAPTATVVTPAADPAAAASAPAGSSSK